MLDFERFEVLSFDCYGTLIDWETGLLQALKPILKAHTVELDDESILAFHGQREAAIEAGPYRPYKDVLKAVLEDFGMTFEFVPTPEQLGEFSRSVALWPAFSDTAHALEALAGKYSLVILSNIDDDLIEASLPKLGVEFHAVFTAEKIGAYKPNKANFEFMLKHLDLPPEKILHVAQSVYHDHVPARSLGLASVWINRRTGRVGPGATPTAEAQPDLELPDLASLVRAIGLGLG